MHPLDPPPTLPAMQLHRSNDEGEMFLVHVTGNCPHAIDGWSRPYSTQAIAESQAVLSLAYAAQHRPDDTDWIADVHRLATQTIGYPVLEPVSTFHANRSTR